MSPIDFPKIYNPANQTPEELIENFVVRTKLFREIFDDIKNATMQYPEQHYIIQGIRGQGKTTLLLRIAYEMENHPDLRRWLIPVVFNEEQYNISRLFRLWETVAEYVDEMNEIKGLYQEMSAFEVDDDYERRCFQLLENALKAHKKKLVLFIDNIDDMLTKFSKKEHQRLREIFIESAEIRVIGASSVSLEFHYDYAEPFYQFFRMPQLKGLTAEETNVLLLKLGECYKRERVKHIVENQPGRVEALRRITGGVIRTIVILFQIFVDDENGTAFMDLEKVLDGVTPLYKHRMEKLSPQQQEIVDFIALSWDAVTTGEIAQRTRLESKAVSSQLKQLERYHLLEKVPTNTKNYLYRISERFFNIWYLMRLGRKWDVRRVRFLVEFLQTWCDESELANRAKRHLSALKRGRLYEKHALFMTEALARTQLNRELQHQLIEATRTYLTQSESELKEYLSHSDYELSEEARHAYNSKDYQAYIHCLEEIKHKTPVDWNSLGIAHITFYKNKQKAEQCFLEALKSNDVDAMFLLGWLHDTEYKDFKQAERYYLMAVEKDDAGAMFNLALLYQTEYKDFKQAETYYLMAVEKDHAGAMVNLALLYETEYKDFKQAERYYLMAVEKDDA
ncbi:AAA family ATPase, partial [candidate division KSB1 bacterium]|nr:AAA family ATPase [candidate division KSB1 bacterium]